MKHIGFVTTRPCSYQEHCKRIEALILEGFHTGEFWKSESQTRYAELEAQELLRAAPAVAQHKQEREDSLAKISETAERVRSQPEIYGNNRMAATAVAGRTQGNIAESLTARNFFYSEEWNKFRKENPISTPNVSVSLDIMLPTDAHVFQFAEAYKARAALRESASPKREVRELCDIHRASVSGCHECQKVDGESTTSTKF